VASRRSDRLRRRLVGGLTFVVAIVVVLAVAPAASAAVQWCGTDQVGSDRIPDTPAGAQVHVAYAIPSDGANRFAQLASPFASDMAAIDSWWRAQDPSRAPRFDLFPFPGCEPGFGQLDISFVRLPGTAEHYNQASPSSLAREIYTDVRAAPFSFINGNKRYLVIYDGPAERQNMACGIAYPTFGFALVFLQPPRGCVPIDLGAGHWIAMVLAHELVHALGALPSGAPHACPGDPGHPCDDPTDVIYGPPEPQLPLSSVFLDPGHDDYYGHSGRWFDVQDSPWLVHVGAPLFSVSTTLSGPGAVASDLPGISCPPACQADYQQGTAVKLTAYAADGYEFASWGGGCTGSTRTCTVTANRATSLTATFTARGTGGGTGGTGGTGGGGSGGTGGGGAIGPRNRPPSARIDVRSSTYEARETVTFTSESFDRDGSIVSQQWTFGDGATATGSTVTHAYQADGSFQVTLSVVDDRGVVDVAYRTVRVKSRPPLVRASPARIAPRGRVDLRFRATDEAGIAGASVAVFRGKRELRRVVRKKGLVSGVNVVRYRAPRKPGVLSWCVQAWDGLGHYSPWACSTVRVG
jgi:hypothetical protein